MGTLALIGLGSNLGDRKAHLDAAVAALAATPGVEVRAVSSYHETAPVGGPGGQGAFLNAAARLDTTLDPHGLLRILHEIEGREGRVRTVRWGERTLDLDLLIFGCTFLDTPELSIPHPRLGLRRFVLAPLAEIAAEIVDTISRMTISDLLANLDRRPSYLAIHGDDGPLKESVFRTLVTKLDAIGVPGVNLTLQPVQDRDRVEPYVEGIKAQTKRLRSDLWPAETMGDRWLISDSCLGLDHRDAFSIVFRLAHDEAGAWSFNRKEIAKKSYERIAHAIRSALPPTFVAVLGGPERLRRRPNAFDRPVFWPESTEADAIVSEILATCAATRPG